MGTRPQTEGDRVLQVPSLRAPAYPSLSAAPALMVSASVRVLYSGSYIIIGLPKQMATRWVAQNNRSVVSHSPGGQRSEIEVWERLDSPKGLEEEPGLSLSSPWFQ